MSLSSRSLNTNLLVGVLLGVFFIRLTAAIHRQSATYDESLYVAYGYSILETGDYRLSMDKPPLVPVIGALPLRWMGLKFDRGDEDWKLADAWIGSAGMASQLASQIDPGYALAWEALAQAFYFKGLRKESREAARRALELDPNSLGMKRLAGIEILSSPEK